jgi:hypothetical protein
LNFGSRSRAATQSSNLGNRFSTSVLPARFITHSPKPSISGCVPPAKRRRWRCRLHAQVVDDPHCHGETSNPVAPPVGSTRLTSKTVAVPVSAPPPQASEAGI